MKHIVLGTAGHVDHGKTLLTKQLTGRDTDRLAEEKERGISIELGFAPMKLSDGTKLSIVDVPGHEHFVKTMMAGASGIDGVLLTVAADDGVMPQTMEHLDILQLLQVQDGILVITKRDLADEERLVQVRDQIRQAVQGTFLEEAPMVEISSVTGEGIDTLKEEIEHLVAQLKERSGQQPARMPIDRVFQAEGFGNIATGTLTEGTLRIGDSIMLYPQQETGTVRTLQNHNRDAKEAQAGTRTAMSMTAGAREHAARGCTIAQPGSMLVSDMLDVRLQITPDCPYRIRNASQLHLFHGTREITCKLRLLDADHLTAGQGGYAQLKLSEPVAVRCGDRFILRFFSPVLTIGGGTILAAGSRRLRRNHAPVLERLGNLDSPELTVRLRQQIVDTGICPIDREYLRMTDNLPEEMFAPTLDSIVHNGDVLCLRQGKLLARTAAEERKKQAESALQRYHDTYPLQPGMPLAQLRGILFPEQEAPAEELLDWMRGDGVFKTEDGFSSLPNFAPVFTQEHKIMQRKLQHYYRDAWFIAPSQRMLDEKFEKRGIIYRHVLANMRLTGKIVPLSTSYAVHFEAYAEALHIFRSLFTENETVTLAQFRTAAGISRKYAQLFLEHWDRKGISRRMGDARILLKPE